MIETLAFLTAILQNTLININNFSPPRNGGYSPFVPLLVSPFSHSRQKQRSSSIYRYISKIRKRPENPARLSHRVVTIDRVHGQTNKHAGKHASFQVRPSHYRHLATYVHIHVAASDPGWVQRILGGLLVSPRGRMLGGLRATEQNGR